jgi:hypothetical protein
MFKINPPLIKVKKQQKYQLFLWLYTSSSLGILLIKARTGEIFNAF